MLSIERMKEFCSEEQSLPHLTPEMLSHWRNSPVTQALYQSLAADYLDALQSQEQVALGKDSKTVALMKPDGVPTVITIAHTPTAETIALESSRFAGISSALEGVFDFLPAEEGDDDE